MCDLKGLREKHRASFGTQQMRENLNPITPFRKAEVASVSRCKKVMVYGNPVLAHKEPTASHKFLIAVNPNIEILMGFVPGQRYMHTFNDATTFRR